MTASGSNHTVKLTIVTQNTRQGSRKSPGRIPRRLRAAIVGVWMGLSAFGVTCVSSYSQGIQPPRGPAPTVTPILVARPVNHQFLEVDDGPVDWKPTHPPLQNLPPVPMLTPELAAGVGATSPAGPGNIRLHDARSQATTEVPVPVAPVQQTLPTQGGGYNGVDGARGWEILPASFGTMSLIPPASRAAFPWRVNCKLAMRWVDNNGSSAWFVASGTMIDAETVVTAGHCVYSREAAFSANPWAQEVYVYPGWDGGDTLIPASSTMYPYGWGRGTLFGSWTSYTDSGNFDFDLGVIRLDRAVGALTGWFGWEYGFDCLANVYNNASYPAESCGGGLHTGRDMYYGSGTWDACDGNNGTMWQVNTISGCLTAVWGGMSGSSAYRFDGNNRYIGAICSLSDRSTRGYYARFFQGWVEYVWNTFIPTYSRGTTFDLQPLNQQVGVNSISAGGTVTGLTHLQVNATDADPGPATYTFRVYLSNNDFISTADTLLGTYSYTWDFAAMGSVTLNMLDEVIPPGTPPGTYWIGVLLEPGTDADASNDNMEGWDARQITVSSSATPLNDNWVNAIGLPSPPTSTTGNNVGATTEPNEQELTSAGATVWWYIEAPAGGTMTIDTFGSDFDTMLHIYTGFENGFANLIPVANNDDAGGGLQSQVTFSVNAGQYYEIRVAGYFGAQGNIQLNVGPVDGGEPDIRITPLDLAFNATVNPPPLPGGPALPPAPRLVGMTASPHAFREVQPDGSPITLHIRGGVSFHWLEDEAGYTVVRDGSKFVYAQLDDAGQLSPTALLVGQADPGAAGIRWRTQPGPAVLQQMRAEQLATAPAAAPPTAVPPVGTVKNVVILMRFANHIGRTLPTQANFDTIFNAAGGDAILAPTGSVRDFYSETSYGTMVLDSTVYAWVTLPQTEQYYANGNSGLDIKIWEAITSALNLADGMINFSQFDSDANGFVDSITFVHSGYGAEWGGTDADGINYTSRIWSHRWQIPTWTSAEGVRVSDYHINPGLWATSGSAPGRIGVICHETGHFFGLPDLYDTDGGGSGIGSYCMMANSWGFTGDQFNPPHFSAWSKIFLGWMTPTVLNAPGSYSLPRAATSPAAFRINNGYPSGEYLLVENRQPFGFESTMPQGGLAIWHIDENKSGNTDEGYPGQTGWPGNNRHYKVALLQADGLFDLERGNNRGDAGDVYHGAGVSEISHNTTPNTDAYQNGVVMNTGNRIFAISGEGATMTFSYANSGGAVGFQVINDGTANLTVSAITPDAAAPWLAWSPPAPFTLSPGAMQFVAVTVDSTQAPAGTTSTRLLVESNDPDESPYPGGVYVNVTTALPTVTVAATDATAGEPGTGEGTGTFTFTRTDSTAAALTVNFSVAGTATSGTDYTALGTTASFVAGSATATKTVSVIDDTVVEGNETVVVTLATGTGYTIGSPSSTMVTIADDDAEVTVAATDAAAAEPSDPGTFTFTRTGYTIPALTVNFTVGGTATSGTDYTAIGTSVNFVAGLATATKTVSVIDDTEVEGDETVEVTLAAGVGYTLGLPSSATVTIADDDEEVSAAAKPRLLSIAESPEGFFTLVWQVLPGRTYRFEVKTNLTDTIWTALGTDFTAESASVVTTNSAGTDVHRFYRVLDVTDL